MRLSLSHPASRIIVEPLEALAFDYDLIRGELEFD
jgi:hypothetical protein